MKINESTGLYENYGLWHTPFWQTQIFYIMLLIGMGVILLILTIVVWKLYSRYRKNKKLSSWDQALLSLRQLSDDQKLHVLHGKEFYLAASSILRVYFYQRYDYQVLNKTDSELVCYLKEQKYDQLILEEIEKILEGGITIKFANIQAAQEQINSDYERIVSIIKRTIPQESIKS